MDGEEKHAAEDEAHMHAPVQPHTQAPSVMG